MSDEIRKDSGGPEEGEGLGKHPHREDVLPKDFETYTPQGGGAGTGSGPIQEVAAVHRETPDSAPKKDLRLEVPRPGDVTLPLLADQASKEKVADALGTPGVAEADSDEPEVSPFRLLLTLGFAGAVAGALLVFVFQWSNPLIQAYDAEVLREAVTEVLKGPERFESVFVVDGALTTQVPEGMDTLTLDKIYLGYDESGNPVGYAMTHAGFGFQDLIRVIFGYDAGAGQVLGMKVLGHAETPGLGNKIEDQPFVGEFDGAEAPLEGVKPDRNTGAANQVDMITGVTISSKAVVRIINDRIAEMEDLLAAFEASGGAPSAGAMAVSGPVADAPGGEEEDR